MLIDCRIGTDDKVLNELKNIKGVAYTHKLIGYYNIIVKVQADSGRELRKVISHKIRKLENISSTTTMIALEK
jgi:DNA-binding Lrp family transcriptional regulator